MKWWWSYRRLRARGILGMNARNAQCILDLNPRERFPLVDGKRRMHELCRSIGVPTPALYGGIDAHCALRRLPGLLDGHTDFVLKPNRGAAGRGVLVVTGRTQTGFIRHNGQILELSDLEQ